MEETICWFLHINLLVIEKGKYKEEKEAKTRHHLIFVFRVETLIAFLNSIIRNYNNQVIFLSNIT